MTTVQEDKAWIQTAQRPAEEAVPDGLGGIWWVAHTKPRSEKALARDLTALGIFHYLPLRGRVTRSRRTGRSSRSVVPVFTGYLFFNATPEQRLLALTTNRIVKTLDVPGQNELVGELRQIQQVLSTDSDFQWHEGVRVGSWARVVAGPLAGLEGVVCRRLSRLRLVLNVRMLAQSVSVEVPREMIEPIDQPSYA